MVMIGHDHFGKVRLGHVKIRSMAGMGVKMGLL